MYMLYFQLERTNDSTFDPYFRYSNGDTSVPFSLQSCSKPLTYCMVQSTDEYIERVHKYVGHEPSGRSFNEISLDYQSMYFA